MTIYRRKPEYVDAIQWDGSEEDAARVIEWVQDRAGEAQYHSPNTITVRVPGARGFTDIYRGAFLLCIPQHGFAHPVFRRATQNEFLREYEEA